MGIGPGNFAVSNIQKRENNTSKLIIFVNRYLKECVDLSVHCLRSNYGRPITMVTGNFLLILHSCEYLFVYVLATEPGFYSKFANTKYVQCAHW